MPKEHGMLSDHSLEKTTKNLLFRHQNKTITDRNQMANEFCKFFTEIGSQYASNIPRSNQNSNQHLTSKLNRNSNTIFLSPTDPQEILGIIKTIKPKSSSGYDGLTSKLLKKIQEPLSVPLSDLINRSISEGVCPDSIKTAKIIPIHKSKETDIFTNYRPISLLPCFSKIFEKVIHKKFCK